MSYNIESYPSDPTMQTIQNSSAGKINVNMLNKNDQIYSVFKINLQITYFKVILLKMS